MSSSQANYLDEYGDQVQNLITSTSSMQKLKTYEDKFLVKNNSLPDLEQSRTK